MQGPTAQLVNEGMTTAQALLAILAPVATFLGGLATLFLRRHFRFMDRMEKAREREVDVLAEIALEMRLSREARTENTRRIEDLEKAIGKKIDDHRTSELTNKVNELVTEQKVAAARTGSFPEVADDEAGRVIEERDRRLPSSQEGPGRYRAGQGEEGAPARRAPLPSRPGR